MIIKSIRFKNTMIFTSILTVLFSIFGIMLYINQKNMLISDIDTFLQATAVSVADSIDTVWEKEKSGVINQSEKQKTIDETIQQYFFKIIKSWLSTNGIEDPKYLNILVQIFDEKAQLIATSRPVPQSIMRLSEREFNSILQGNHYISNNNIETQPNQFITLRFLSLPIITDEKLSYIVRVAISLRTMKFSLSNLKIILFILIPSTIIVAGFIGLFLTNITLYPVNNMIQTIKRITAKNLKLRINIPDSKDEILNLANTFNDMLDRLHNSFESQKQLIEDLYHELKTPLSIMRGEIEIILKKNRDNEAYKDILYSNMEEIDKLARLIENLLLISKFESKIITFEYTLINLNIIINDVVETFKILSEPKNIEINIESKENIIIYADEKQIKTLFINIIDNAIKYNDDNGKILIKLTKNNEFCIISIINTGVGIPEEEIPFIFDRYYRAIKSKKVFGTGLGLSISKSIVDAHNGKIEVDSKPNKETVFTIKLPLIKSN
ncbi:MAG: hypothetical protein A2086_09845 [Spirochaetes bacterium GWD1_27_9]|nr:MAG: hypothetical protein A2Z98_08610 [Spirochaetes bacterium GWB1_27_13]OHD26495.1 MAG: hypothetical protein A2Y34_12845 [Spirochaetes bacterium GWC1_27_15]OHD42037.1 MAG: hypothetical protein A2086_09845 [Spirochaetes bacterium GWD1_27_9]